MIEKRIDWDNCYMIVLTQPLNKGYYIQQVYYNKPNGWMLRWDSNYPKHICPYDGIFRSCYDCGIDEEDFEVNYCLDKEQIISKKELIKRIKLAEGAGCEVKFAEGDING